MSRPQTWSFQSSISFISTLGFINNKVHQPCSYPNLLVNLSLVGFHQGSKPFFFIWRIIALQWCVGFCHITTWISHNHLYICVCVCVCVCVSAPLKPPSPLLLHPSRSSQSTSLGSLCCAAALHQLSVSHMVVLYMPRPLSQFVPPSPSRVAPTSFFSMSVSLFLPWK